MQSPWSQPLNRPQSPYLEPGAWTQAPWEAASGPLLLPPRLSASSVLVVQLGPVHALVAALVPSLRALISHFHVP